MSSNKAILKGALYGDSNRDAATKTLSDVYRTDVCDDNDAAILEK